MNFIDEPINYNLWLCNIELIYILEGQLRNRNVKYLEVGMNAFYYLFVTFAGFGCGDGIVFR